MPDGAEEDISSAHFVNVRQDIRKRRQYSLSWFSRLQGSVPNQR
jgi:hypothetical protein